MNNILSKLTNTDASKINYFNKMKTEIKITKILYTSDSFYGRQYEQYNKYYKNYKKLIVARPKNMIYLKLVPGGLPLCTNKMKYRFINITTNQLYLNLYLHELGGKLTPKIKLTVFVNLLLTCANIKKLTLILKYSSVSSNQQQLKYNQQIQYLRQHIQKYCNDIHVTIRFYEVNFECDFWNNADCTKTGKCAKITKKSQWVNSCKRISRAVIDKTKYNFHRNFKLEQREIKQNK